MVNKATPDAENNLFFSLLYKYLPYWPLFVLLLLLGGLAGWGYLSYATPVYETTATLIITDEKKGMNDPRIYEAIDVFNSTKIVENEMEVIQSRALMKQVVDSLNLYAPIYEEGEIKSLHAYSTSPIIIKAKYPEKIRAQEKVYFSYNSKTSKVKIKNKEYPLDTWVRTPYGTFQFQHNLKQEAMPTYPLYFSLENPRIVTEGILGRLDVKAANKLSSVINLSLQDPVPQRGEDILNQLIYAYNQLAVIDRNVLAANTLAFIEDRIKFVEKELDVVENEVQQYKSTKGIVDLGEQGKLFLQNVGDNDRKLAEVNLQLAVLDKVERYVVSKENSASIVPSTLGLNDPVLAQLLQKLYDTEIQYQKLSKTTAENNPILVSVTDEIEKIRPSILESIRNQRVNLQASKANLASTNGQYNSVLQKIPKKERELLEISRQQAIKNSVYSFLLQKREETALSYAPTSGDSRVVDMAEAALLPVSPKPFTVYLIAAVLAMILGVTMVTSKELLNQKILFRSEIVDCTHAPIVAELSYVKPRKGPLFKEPSEVFVVEQFRQMRATMGLYGRTFSKKKIMVTSSIPGEGKSFVSTNLALSLALSGKKVILIDLDLRNPNTSVLFDLLKHEGITEYLVGELDACDMIISTEYENLSIMPAGARIGDNSELLLNGRLEALFKYLETEFDYILVDTPPVTLVSDAYLITEFCDISLYVIRHDYTPKVVVQRLEDSNISKSLTNMAIVFNGVKARGFVKGEYGYGYGYGNEYVYKRNKYGMKAT
ncbi:polysaccharide biosynthesis tyrosine autokinase [Pontibacter sp. KCTC 32443]|uniref:GumC family protein n=1 Tax=Pontibacter TaxID=323449 RepID=UPI00164DA386|nr:MULTISPECIES: tyrosine-protein kinase family protein [Pontibacter]MBC5773712.1 polysaccharide biosynthesis tyrosine autokinase [Pontibacter sp. KCTC 32443]